MSPVKIMKPKIIFLFVLLIESSLSIIEKSSLTFVIDDTGSMGDDIDQVKNGANLVFDTVLRSNGSQIENFILVTFNDPGFKLRIVTKDQEQYKRELEAIYVDGGDDCAEMSMSGIELALKESLPGSYLYVFTDASAKDFNLSERVQNLAIKKQTQIVFLLTGRCTSDDNDPQYQAYYHLADATSGQVFHMYKQDVGKILQYVAETVSSRKTVVTRRKFPPGYGYNVTIPVDAGMKDVVISESGREPTINVTAPDGSRPELEHLVDTSDVVAVKIPVAMPGNYTAELGSKSETNVVVTAATSIDFKHGFSTVLPTSIKGTATRPIANAETFLAIELVTKEPGVTLKSVEILDVDENFVTELPLKLFNKKQKLYITTKLLAPYYLFKLAAKGYDVKSKSSFRRITPTAIEPQKPDLELPDGKKPIVKIENGLKINAKYGEPLKIPCNVNGYPKPDIIWLDNNGTMLSSSVSTVEIPYDHINILEINNVTSNSSYTCKSANEYGEDLQIVEVETVQIKEAPKIDKTENVFYFAKGEPGEINCSVIKGNPKPKIVWYFLPLDAQWFVKMDETEERISWNNVEDAQAGIYRCEAINEVGYDNFKLYLVVDYPPIIQPGLTYVKSIEGKTTKLTCNVQGIPKPRVDWYLNGVKIISDRKHHIYRDNSLRFQGSVQNQGQFTCVATNSLGSTNRTVNVNYIAPVAMDPPEQSTFETKVGGNLQLPCSADGYPQPMIKWLFFRSEKDTTPKKLWARDASGLLYLSHIQLNQDGYYTCVASNGYTSANLTYQVKIFASPDINTPPQSFTAVVGDLVLRLPCEATGKPRPAITWTKNGFNIAAGSEWYDIQSDGTLIIKSVDNETGGAYVCIATNSLGNDHEMFNVIITSQPEKTPDTTIIVEEGKSKKIKCAIPHKIVDSLRWFKDGKLIATGELSLRNVKLTDRGIYTCRVSTFHSSESSSTKVVVGTKPIFYENPEPVINFEEDMPAFLNCEALGEPAPKVMWSHEGLILDYTDMVYETVMTFDKRGKYTCTVDNLFGSINRTFEISSKECVLNIKQDFTTNQPLMVDDSFRLPLFENNNVFMRVPNEETIVLHCPSGFANIPKKTVMATCVREKDFRIGRDIYEFSQLTCQEEVKPKVVKTGNRCTPTESEIVKVGYEINERFIEVFEVCLDKDKNAPVYAKHRVHRSLVDTEPDLVWSWHNDDSLPLEFDEIYDCGIQIERISSNLGRWFHPDDKCCFKKRQLVNPRDLLGGLPQKATYNYLNVVPQWSSCNSKNWDELEKRVRLLAKSSYDDLLVWTGTSGYLELPNSEGSPEDVQLLDSQYLHQSIPRYVWKVVQNPDTNSSLAIVQLNIPDLTPVEAYRHMACRDICRDVTWMAGYRWRNPQDGYTFCCSLEEFEQAFGYKGRFGSENRNILNSVSYLSLHSLG